MGVQNQDNNDAFPRVGRVGFIGLGKKFFSFIVFNLLETISISALGVGDLVAVHNIFYLVIVMGLVIPWSLTLALVDAWSIFVKCPRQQQGIILFIIVGDWALSFLTLATSSSTASVTDFILKADSLSFCHSKRCNRYELSAVNAFLSWLLLSASSLFNLWRLPSL